MAVVSEWLPCPCCGNDRQYLSVSLDAVTREPEAFAFFGWGEKRFLVTANKDGSIPLDSRCVAELNLNDLNIELLTELLRRANSANAHV